MGEFTRDESEVGALWLKTGSRGEYMTGTIEGIGPVVCFRNSSDNPKAPAWRVLKSKPQAERAERPTRPGSQDIGW